MVHGGLDTSSQRYRAFKETENFRKSSKWWFWGVDVVGSAVLAAITAALIINTLPNWLVGILTFVVFVIGIALIYGIIYLWHLFRAPYKQLGEWKAEILRLKTEKGNISPEIAAGKPWAEIGKIEKIANRIWAAGVCFGNVNPNGISAENVWANIAYVSEDEKEQFCNVIGLWDEKGDRSVTPLKDDMREVELKASGLPYTIVLAIKYPDDDVCYAYNAENYQFKDLRMERHRLVGNKFHVLVSLKGKNIIGLFDDVGFHFILYNEGLGKGLRLEEYKATK
jgi:hypothetical protein